MKKSYLRAMNFTSTYPLLPPHSDIGRGYRYFFNGQEADNEVFGEGALHAFEYRMHDTRIGRFWSVDPLAGKFPWNSVCVCGELADRFYGIGRFGKENENNTFFHIGDNVYSRCLSQ